MNPNPAYAGVPHVTFSPQYGEEVFLCPESELNPNSCSC
jgi:hypothetical protein